MLLRPEEGGGVRKEGAWSDTLGVVLSYTDTHTQLSDRLGVLVGWSGGVSMTTSSECLWVTYLRCVGRRGSGRAGRGRWGQSTPHGGSATETTDHQPGLP